MNTPRYRLEAGRAHPLGAVPDHDGVNFSVFADHATAVDLLLFEKEDDLEPRQVVSLDPRVNKTFHFWHVYVKGLRAGAHYAYRVDGPSNVSQTGNRYNPNKVLIDPYGKGTTTGLWSRGGACGEGDNIATSMRSVVVNIADYDWEGDHTLNRRMRDTIVYETHVGGFTKSPTSGVNAPGTFRGLIEKIPYLKELGITAVELLPVFHFDASDVDRPSPTGDGRLTNFWGYSTVSFFAPHPGYCATADAAAHVNEFRDMVKTLHRAGIEVLLDVVFNHTSEGNHQGPTMNFRGFDNSIYYHLVRNDKQYYMDYSGCGNTVYCNHPVVEKFIVDCLEYWVRELHVDGFRFDEGSILARGEDGVPMAYPPVIWHIELSETLSDSKIIAEAWDAAGLYQIGYFPGYRWAEWNGKYRDDIRRFVKGDSGLISAVASRIAGSADLYQGHAHLPINSINFIDCHDGFTLNDLVVYNEKHNFANGEDNHDGNDENLSWNCGVEGLTDDPGIEAFRLQQLKNFAAILFISRGVPMIVAGDEVRRTQSGNNNAYCQDNPLSWFDWTLPDSNTELLRFFRQMIAFRKRNTVMHEARFFTGEINERGLTDIAWHGCNLNGAGWNDPNCRVLAFTIGGTPGGPDFHVILNMDSSALEFELPEVNGRKWYRAVDTSLPAPDDASDAGDEVQITSDGYHANAHSVVILISKTPEGVIRPKLRGEGFDILSQA